MLDYRILRYHIFRPTYTSRFFNTTRRTTSLNRARKPRRFTRKLSPCLSFFLHDPRDTPMFDTPIHTQSTDGAHLSAIAYQVYSKCINRCGSGYGSDSYYWQSGCPIDEANSQFVDSLGRFSNLSSIRIQESSVSFQLLDRLAHGSRSNKVFINNCECLFDSRSPDRCPFIDNPPKPWTSLTFNNNKSSGSIYLDTLMALASSLSIRTLDTIDHRLGICVLSQTKDSCFVSHIFYHYSRVSK
jgi:hypothetical protein